MASARTVLLVLLLPLAACPGPDDDGSHNPLDPDAGTGSADANIPPRPDAPPTPVCGDGMRVQGEPCDDGNTISYDGCSAGCQVEVDCTCSGSPSTCSCTPAVTTTTQTITTTTERVETASLALDATGQPHVSWFYSVNFTDPVTGYSREHAHAMFAERYSATQWSNTEIQTWDQTQTSMSPNHFKLAYDGNALRAFFHRIYATNGTFETATHTGQGWTFATDNPYYSYDVTRAGGNWHALVGKSAFYDLHYLMGTPGGWTRDETLTGFSTSYPTRLAATNAGDVFLSSITPNSNHTAYNLKLSKRLNGFTWDTVYDVQTTGTCVYPITHNPLVLDNDDLLLIEDGFSTGTGAQRWLRAHRLVGSTWTTETIADLSWYGYAPTCSTGGASWTTLPMVTAADALGQPHIVYAGAPWNNSTTIEDHYRDASGWHVRTYPLAKAMPLDMKIDAQGTVHIIATTPGSTSGSTRLTYLRINATGWTAAP